MLRRNAKNISSSTVNSLVKLVKYGGCPRPYIQALN